MNAGLMMIVGAAVSLTGLLMDITGHDAVVIIFAGGALFGKGYGIWEERTGGGG